MSTRPLVYFWIANYNNGSTLSQFDPITFKENSFNDINQEKLIKFGLYPFTRELALGVKDQGNPSISIPILPVFEININKDRRLIYYRDVFISQEEFHFCNNCKKEFFYSLSYPTVKSKFPSPICPHCGEHDVYICKNCRKEWRTWDEAPGHKCTCGSLLDRKVVTSTQHGREKRWIEYFLGYQTTINGRNQKFLLKIKENGNCEIV